MPVPVPRRSRRAPRRDESPGGPPARSLPVRRTQLVRVAVWVAVATGPLALAVSCARPGVEVRTRQAPVTQAGAAKQPQSDVGGYAELFLDVWLRAGAGEQSAATRQLRAMAPAVQPPSWNGKGPVAEHLTVVRTVRQTGTAWSVTLAARFTTPAGRGGRGPGEAESGVRYFAVPLLVQDTSAAPGTARGFVVPAAPMEVSAPRTAPAPESAYGAEVPAESSLAQAAGEFLTAYLGAAEGADRYLTPGVSLPPLRSARFERVQVDEVRAQMQTDGKATSAATARLLVQVTASDGSGGQWPLAYGLKVAARDGRWEVLALQSGLEGAAERSKPHTGRSASTPAVRRGPASAVRAVTVSPASQEEQR